MFEIIKRILGKKKLTISEQIQKFDLTNKPFAQALFLRAAEYHEEAYHDLKRMGVRLKPLPEVNNLKEFASSCALTIAHYITTEA